MPDTERDRPPHRHLEDYIGDGAYVYMDDAAQVVLYTSDGYSATNTVVLEPAVLENFKRWMERRDEYIELFQRRRDEDKCLKNLQCIFSAGHEDECGFMVQD